MKSRIYEKENTAKEYSPTVFAGECERKKVPTLHMVTQLWGQAYVELYANYVIPSLLQEGNLPALADSGDGLYEIYTTAADREVLEGHHNFQLMRERLVGWLAIRFANVEGSLESPYAVMSSCHRRAILAAEARDAAILFLQPDVVVAPGSLATVARELRRGKRLVLTPGLRAAREEITQLLRHHLESPSGPSWPTSRELVAAAIDQLHPISQLLFWRNGTVNSYCSHIYWRFEPKGIYARCAHMHPLMVYPVNKGCDFNHTIDWDYFYRACPDTRTWFVAPTSDEVCLIELSDRAKFAGTETLVPARPETIAQFMAHATEAPHLHLLEHRHLFLGTDCTEKDWIEVHEEAVQIIQEAVDLSRRARRRGLAFTLKISLLTSVKKLRDTNEQLLRLKERRSLIGLTVYPPYRVSYLILRTTYRAIQRAAQFWLSVWRAAKPKHPPLSIIEQSMERQILSIVGKLGVLDVRLQGFRDRHPRLGTPTYDAFKGSYRLLRGGNRRARRIYRFCKSVPYRLLGRRGP